MKQLMDWLSNSHWTPDTGMLTYLFLSNGTQANRDHCCPVRRRFEEFTSHQLDFEGRHYTQTLLLKVNEAHVWRRGTCRQVLITSNPESQHPCFTSSPYSSAAATPTEWQLAPATRVTLLLPSKECEGDKKCQKPNMSSPACPNHTTQTKNGSRVPSGDERCNPRNSAVLGRSGLCSLGCHCWEEGKSAFLCLGFSVGLTASPLVVSYGGWSLY